VTAEFLAEWLDQVARRLRTGCRNHGCVVNPPAGQATNAGCTCDPYSISRELGRIERSVTALVAAGNRWDKNAEREQG
jgi:hypothetical protein